MGVLGKNYFILVVWVPKLTLQGLGPRILFRMPVIRGNLNPQAFYELKSTLLKGGYMRTIWESIMGLQ